MRVLAAVGQQLLSSGRSSKIATLNDQRLVQGIAPGVVGGGPLHFHESGTYFWPDPDILSPSSVPPAEASNIPLKRHHTSVCLGSSLFEQTSNEVNLGRVGTACDTGGDRNLVHANYSQKGVCQKSLQTFVYREKR